MIDTVGGLVLCSVQSLKVLKETEYTTQALLDFQHLRMYYVYLIGTGRPFLSLTSYSMSCNVCSIVSREHQLQVLV